MGTVFFYPRPRQYSWQLSSHLLIPCFPLPRLSFCCRYPCQNVQQHKGSAGHTSHLWVRLKLKSVTRSVLFHLNNVHLLFLYSSQEHPSLIVVFFFFFFFSFYFPSFPCFFFPLVWCGCPSEDDLSGQSYHPFGRVGIITMEWCTHLHAYRHGNMDVHADWKHPPHKHFVDTHTHTDWQTERNCERKCNTARRRGGEELQMKQLDAACTDLYPDLYQNA